MTYDENAPITAKQLKTPGRTSPAALDKDAPLKEDIRMLGRLLGDVLRAQEGDAVYEVVETVRRTVQHAC